LVDAPIRLDTTLSQRNHRFIEAFDVIGQLIDTPRERTHNRFKSRQAFVVLRLIVQEEFDGFLDIHLFHDTIVRGPERQGQSHYCVSMNLSVKSEYALQAVLDLALQPPGESVKIADIARRQKIPQKFLELILASLKQGGFVESRRGAEGGYRLAKPAAEITIGQVMHYVEEGKRIKRGASHPFADLWKRVDDAISSIVDHTTFADLARRWKESQTRYVANWEI
jgi:Rrf2 family cysteine metabolism transcriptional repressor